MIRMIRTTGTGGAGMANSGPAIALGAAVFVMWLAPDTISGADFKQLRIPVASHADDLHIADLNADGYSDIVTIDLTQKKLRVFLGDSKQSYSKTTLKSYSRMGLRILGVADFTGDGKLDVAVDASGGDLLFAIFPGKGNGEFLSPKLVRSSAPEPEFGDAAVLDLDADGRPDIAGLLTYYQYDSPRSVSVFRNLGGSKFSILKVADDVIYDGLVAGDFNSDGFDDIAVRAEDATELVVFQNSGAGTFLEGRAIDVKTPGSSLAAGDVNGDGKPDLAGEGTNSPYGWVLLGKGNGTFWKKTPIPGSNGHLGYDLIFGDVTGDSKTDLVAAVPGPYNSAVEVYPGSGAARLGKPATISRPESGFFTHNGNEGNLGVGDANKDGKNDVFAAQYKSVDGYDNPVSYEMQNILVFQSGAKPVNVTISNLRFTTLSYSSQQVTMVGSFTFQDTGKRSFGHSKAIL